MSKYYDYLKKYDSHFLNKYESWTHYAWGRRSNFLQLLYYRAYTLVTGRQIFMPHLKLKSPYQWICLMICLADVYGIWYFQEISNKYTVHKQVYYQPYMKPQMVFQE